MSQPAEAICCSPVSDMRAHVYVGLLVRGEVVPRLEHIDQSIDSTIPIEGTFKSVCFIAPVASYNFRPEIYVDQ
jgi:hypothetical protein